MKLALLTHSARRRAEEAMIDECEIRRPSTLGELDSETGQRPEAPGDLVYLGKCKAFTYEPFESTPESGQHVYTVQRKQVHVPVHAEGIRVSDEVTLTVASMDDDLMDRKFRVAGIHNVTAARDRRLLVEEITA